MAQRISAKLVLDPVLRVLPRGTALVSDYSALMAQPTSMNRFHGWRFDSTLGPEFQDKDASGQSVTKRHGGRVKLHDAVIEIASDDPYRAEYLRHLRDGDLWAADKATADAAGVPFEPHFGGEHPKCSASHGLDGETLGAALTAAGFDPLGAPAAVPWDTSFRPRVVADSTVTPSLPATSAVTPALTPEK